MRNLFLMLTIIIMLVMIGCKSPKKTTSPQGLMPPRIESKFTKDLTFIKAAAAERMTALPWKYPLNHTNYWWDLQASSNLVNWTTIITNLGSMDPIVYSTNSIFQFFRLKGHE